MIDLKALVVVSLLVSSTSSAQIAVALTLPDPNPTHKAIAAGVVTAVSERWELLQPALAVHDVALCAGELDCLQKLAAKQSASQLLVVAVAGLGGRDAAVSVQLYDAAGAVLFDDNAVIVGTADPAKDATPIAARLLATPGMPPRVDRPVRATGSNTNVAGAGLLGAGVVVSLGAIAASAALVDTAPDTALYAAIGGVGAGVALSAIGAVLVVAGE